MEVDETYISGRFRSFHYNQRQERRLLPYWGRIVVAGARERETRRVRVEVIPDTMSDTLIDFVTRYVDLDQAMLYTDDALAYSR